MLRADTEKIINPAFESGGVFLPDKVMQIDPDGVEADLLGPATLAVDCIGVISVFLPHLKLIYRGAGNEVAADRPASLCIPGVCLLLRHRLIRRLSRKTGQRKQNGYTRGKYGFHNLSIVMLFETVAVPIILTLQTHTVDDAVARTLISVDVQMVFETERCYQAKSQ